MSYVKRYSRIVPELFARRRFDEKPVTHFACGYADKSNYIVEYATDISVAFFIAFNEMPAEKSEFRRSAQRKVRNENAETVGHYER